MKIIKSIFSFLFFFYPSERLANYYKLIRGILSEDDNNIKKKIDSYYENNVIPSYIYYAIDVKKLPPNGIRKILKTDLYYLEKNMVIHFSYNIAKIMLTFSFAFLIFLTFITSLSLSIIYKNVALFICFATLSIAGVYLIFYYIKTSVGYYKTTAYFSIEKDTIEKIIEDRLSNNKDEKIFVREKFKKEYMRIIQEGLSLDISNDNKDGN